MALSVRKLIINLAKAEKRKTFFICTHNLEEAETLCSKIAVIENGKILYQGDIENLKSKLFPYRKIEFELIKVEPHIVKAIQKLDSIKEVKVCGRTLIVYVDNRVARARCEKWNLPKGQE
jgi:ABC-2 type transport system ATP-binding protein